PSAAPSLGADRAPDAAPSLGADRAPGAVPAEPPARVRRAGAVPRGPGSPVPGLRALLRGRPLLADTLFAAALWLGETVLWLLGPAEFRPRFWPIALTYSLLGMATVALRRRCIWVALVLLSIHTAVPLAGVRDLQTEGVAVVILTY